MALTIKGTPQKVKSVGSLRAVANDGIAASAVRQAATRGKEDDEQKRREGRGGRRSR